MKNRYNYIFGFIVAISFLNVGCEGFLDKQPISELSRDKFWKTPKDADIWIAGMYDGLQSTLGSNMFLWGELRSDNCQQGGTGTNQVKYISNTLTSDMKECNWTNLYKTISSANFTIKYIPTIPGVNLPQVAGQLGQAYGMRALMYFWAIRIWGPVPLITEPYEGLPGQEKFLLRSSVEDIKTHIFSDIDKALEHLDTNTPSIFEINRGSVLSLQTDVFMWFKMYQEAINSSDKLIAMKKYDYATNSKEWKGIFESPVNSKESIFNIYWDYLADGGGNDYAKEFGSGSVNPQYKMRRELWDTLVTRHTDARLWNMVDTVKLYYLGNMANVTYESYNLEPLRLDCIKYALWDPTRGDHGAYVHPSNQECSYYLPVYRYSNIMLLRAEALNKLGKRDEAMAIINLIRNRMGYAKTITPQNTPNEVLLEDAILTERQIELFSEGTRWFDLVRTGKVLGIMDPIIKAQPYNVPEGFGDIRRILFPLHSSTFEANPNLIQNEPYTQN